MPTRNQNPFLDAFTQEIRKRMVWNKGHVIVGQGPDEWRRDHLGNIIQFSEYGNRNSTFGWEIDHILQVRLGGSDDLSNLRPLQWWANVQRG